jgi:hypothetical protein
VDGVARRRGNRGQPRDHHHVLLHDRHRQIPPMPDDVHVTYIAA